tara:strand:- start:773 stop:1396 length:624 start_codon:yes stop_codon:yes gene_type:complete
MTKIPEINFLIDCHKSHAEVMELSSKTVWQSRLPMDRETLENLSLPSGFINVGIGTAVMDAHYFRRSPGNAKDGPVSERDISGHQFIHCANPPVRGAETPIPGGPQLLKVDKHHSLVFMPDRKVDVLCLPDGEEYIQVISATPEGGGIMQKELVQPESVSSSENELPEGWHLRSVTFLTRTTIHLPNPTQCWFFADGASFQGVVGLR